MNTTSAIEVVGPSPNLVTSLEGLAAKLMTTRSLLEITQLQTQVNAFKMWVRTKEGGQVAAREAAAIVVWAERKIGELASQLPQSSSRFGSQSDKQTKRSILVEAGVEPRRARDAEKLAKVPSQAFEEYVNRPSMPSVGGALVEFGIREKYSYPSFKEWRSIAVDAVQLLERQYIKNGTAPRRAEVQQLRARIASRRQGDEEL